MKLIHYILVIAQVSSSLPVFVQANQSPAAKAPGVAPVAGEKPYRPQIHFSAEVQDRMVYDAYQSANRDEAYQFAAVAYAAWGASNAYSPKMAEEVTNWVPPNEMIYAPSLEAPTYTKQEFIEKAISRQMNSIDGFKIQGTVGDGIITGVLGLAAPELGVTAPLILPVVREGILRVLEKAPTDPDVAQDVARLSALWAFNEIRSGSVEGQALEKAREKYRLPDPKADRSYTQAVQDGESKVLSLRQSKDVAKLVDTNGQILTSLDEMQKELAGQAQVLKEMKDKKLEQLTKKITPEGLERAAYFRDTSDMLNNFSFLLSLTDHAKEAEMVEKMAKAAKALEMINTATTMSGLAAANIYLYAALMIYSAIKISSGPKSPYPAIFAMLAQISKQIEELRVELGTRLNQIDNHLAAFAAQSIALSQANLQSTAVVNQVLTRLQEQLRLLQSRTQIQLGSLADLQMNAEDRECFLQDGKGNYLGLDERQFIICRNTYVDRGTIFARSLLAHDLSGSSATQGYYNSVYLPAADRYESLRQLVDPDGQEYRQPLAHPSVWYQSAKNISLLNASQKNFRADFTDQLDALVSAGQDLRAFRASLLFSGKGVNRTFRTDRVQKILQHLQSVQQRSLVRIQQQVSAPAAKVDPTRGLKQAVNASFPFRMFAQSIPFCPDARARSFDFIQFLRGVSGGGHGWNVQEVRADMLNHPGYVELEESRFDASMASLQPNELGWDLQLLTPIAKEILLFEQSQYMEALTQVCIRELQLTQYSQTEANIFDAQIKITLEVYSSFATPTERVAPFKVQTLQAQIPFHGIAGGGAMINMSPRLHDIFVQNWNSIRPALLAALTDVSDSLGQSNRANVKGKLQEFFGKAQEQMRAPILNAINQDQEDFAQGMNDLKAILAIGTAGGGDAKTAWDQCVNEKLGKLSPLDLAQSAIAAGVPVPDLDFAVQSTQSALTESLANLAKEPRLVPALDLLAAPMKSLEQILWMKSVPPTRLAHRK